MTRSSEPAPPESALARVSSALPALARAQELQSRAAEVGFDWPTTQGILAKISEEIGELEAAVDAAEREDELGDVLFSLVNLARHLGVSAEQALESSNRKFTRRFQAIEAACRDRGVQPKDLSLEELDDLWEQAKRAERSAP